MTTPDNKVRAWVSSIKAAYPDLPEHLTIEIEKDRLDKLSRWRERVESLRQYYDYMDTHMLPDDLREEGKRQVVPVLMSLDSMTDEESKAWHHLFCCLAAMQAEIALGYYTNQASGSNSMNLEDILNYLPIVFLYVLSSYDPYPNGKGFQHEEDFSHSDDGRVRLHTWVHLDMRRHISSYLHQHAHTVRQGSTTIQRLRVKIRRAEDELTVQNGYEPSPKEVIRHIPEVELTPDDYAEAKAGSVVSIDRPLSPSTDATYAETIESGTDPSDSFDPTRYLIERSNTDAQRRAIRKLLESDEILTPKERFDLGS